VKFLDDIGTPTMALHGSPRRTARRPRTGFTLVEALVSITIAAMASSALYLGLIGSLNTAQHSLEQTIANGIAEQLIDEVLGQMYVTGGDPRQATLGPDAWESAGVHCERFNDIDDYAGVFAAPPKDAYGVPLGSENGTGGLRSANFRALGSFMANWREEIDVYYVNESDSTTKVTTPTYMRVVEVRIYEVQSPTVKRLITQVKRVHGYVPPPL
jgi:prepilin-type N-terminal cleavage/methylation domain-containing protein